MRYRVRAAASMACVLVCLAACQSGANYHPPAPPQSAYTPLVSLNAALETSDQPPAAWWRLYDDPRLDQLIEEALLKNRDLAAADANLEAARAVLAAVDAQRLPSTQVVAGAVYGRDPATEEILEIAGDRPKSLWVLEDASQMNYEVDLFGRIHRAIEEARANTESVAAARDITRVVVAAETSRAYVALCALGEEIDVARRSLEIVSHEAQITAKRFEAGAGSEFDVDRTQAEVSLVQAAIPRLAGERQTALFELAALLGRTPADAPQNLDTCVSPPRLTKLIPVGDGRMLIRRRPDVRQAERRLAAATARIGIATADLYPAIHLSGFYGGAASQVPELTHNLGLMWGLGPSISWNFPNETGPRARVRQARASELAALATFDSVVLTALKEAEQALANYSAALDRRQALADAQQRIHRSFDVAQAEYTAGALSSLDLLTTEQSLVALDAAVASSDAELAQDQISLFKALGGGWQANQ